MKCLSKVQTAKITSHYTSKSGCLQVTLPRQPQDKREKLLIREPQPLALSKLRKSPGQFSKLLNRQRTKRCPIRIMVEHKSQAVGSNKHLREMRKPSRRSLLRATSPIWQTHAAVVNYQSAPLRHRISQLLGKSSLQQRYHLMQPMLDLQPKRPKRCLRIQICKRGRKFQVQLIIS